MNEQTSEFISREKILDIFENEHVPVTGIRLGLGKIFLVEYTTKLREYYSNAIRNIPPANVVPETYGEWVDVGKTNKGTPIRKCSRCGVEKAGRPKSSYCPDCGCRMDLTGSSVIEGQQSFLI